MPKYKVLLCRSRYETAEVELEAESPEDLLEKYSDLEGEGELLNIAAKAQWRDEGDADDLHIEQVSGKSVFYRRAPYLR